MEVELFITKRGTVQKLVANSRANSMYLISFSFLNSVSQHVIDMWEGQCSQVVW
jgi:hypothetical protein